ncbi:MAG TPA: hypothetical protein VGN84_00825 [Solirubrobacterales bacterium]|jgi:hypothetical protein|nr:hypothetical protein [Solirubrobacterales bacterium]
MIFVIGMRLAEAASEHILLVIIAMAIVVLLVLWPRITRRIEDGSRHR